MRWARALPCLSAIFIIVILTTRQWGLWPPLLFVLNPFTGLWVNGDPPVKNETLYFNNLIGLTNILFDQQRIPHIFAANEYDAYFAQGYVTARDRLWQMEIQSRVVEGRLSEIFGQKTLESDRFMLRSGLNEAAHANFKKMMEDPITRQAIEAYTAGVNQFVSSLKYKDFPPEYKILNITPRRWRPQYTAFIIKLMDFTLSTKSSDLRMSRVLSKFGFAVVKDLFPLFPFNNEPIIPKGTLWSRWPSNPLPAWEGPVLDLKELPPIPESDPDSGSNNWVVDGKKSTTGYPILANDTHLFYRLPNLWYEIQLTYGNHSVYGVSIPGTPGITIGFNKNIAWGITSAYTDVMDWYKIQFKNSDQREYFVDGGWKKTEFRSYRIKVRGKNDDVIEKVPYTIFGPVVYRPEEKGLKPDFGGGLALKWATHYAGNELSTFLRINSSKNYYEARSALGAYYCPPLNFLIADNAGRIGVIQRGLFPKRQINQGRFVMDGRMSSQNWKEFYSLEDNPQVINPPQGFLFSANQTPVNENFPFYLGTEFGPPYRALRIAEILRSKPKFSPHDFLQMQNDNYSRLAAEILPTLLKLLDTSELDPPMKFLSQILSKWRYRYKKDSVFPIVLDQWIIEISHQMWQDRFGSQQYFEWPSISMLSYLLNHRPESFWFDSPQSSEKETAHQIVTSSFKKAVNSLVNKYGEDIKKWRWGEVQKAEFSHITKLPAFGRLLSDVSGSRHSIFAHRGDHGPIFKMLVALGPKPQGWMIIAGGPSGNPLSRYYDSNLKIWKKGLMRAVNFWPTLESAQDYRFKIELRKKSG